MSGSSRVDDSPESVFDVVVLTLVFPCTTAGRFQHSSLLGGSRVTSAGLIKADEVTLTSLSPLSGHYRAGTMHFKSFVRSLEEQHCDMSRFAPLFD